MAAKNQLNITLDEAVMKEVEDVAKLLDQKPSAIGRRIVTENIASFKARAIQAAAILNEPPAKYAAVKARPARPKGTRRADRN